jgi:hypothetical protein
MVRPVVGLNVLQEVSRHWVVRILSANGATTGRCPLTTVSSNHRALLTQDA